MKTLTVPGLIYAWSLWDSSFSCLKQRITLELQQRISIYIDTIDCAQKNQLSIVDQTNPS